MTDSPAMNRGTRRRLRTRAKLLQAGLEVMAEKGLDAATINEITEAADVGFGSFYNHFESKDALFQALIQLHVDGWSRRLDALQEQTGDHAEILAAAIRHSLDQVRRDRTWGWFLYRIGPRMLRTQSGLVGRMVERIRRGSEADRFRNPDPEMAMRMAVGGILGAIAGILHDELGQDAGDRTARQVLVLLGLDAAEADRLVARPLPALGPPLQESADLPVTLGSD